LTFLKNNIICAKSTNVLQYVVIYKYGSYGQRGESMKKGANHAKVQKISKDSIFHMANF
jgi:hypothetical protein